jgi:hypothetical protein
MARFCGIAPGARALALPSQAMAELPSGTDAPARCTNCFEPLPEPRPRFCPHCGQETNVRPPRLGEFIQQFGGAFLSTEGALWRTFKLLLFRPGELTRQYLDGRRKHYVLPLRLYLTVSVIALVLMRVLMSLQVDVSPGIRIDTSPQSVTIDLGFGRAGLKGGQFFCESLPQTICKRLERRLTFDPKHMDRELAEFGQRLLGNFGAAMFLLLPVFAALLKFVYRNRRLHYTEHLVCALHLHAFWFIAFMLMLLNQGWLSTLALLSMPIYTLLAFGRVYRGRWWPRLLRAAVVAPLYGIALGVVMGGAALWSMLF